jgi:hypothetical protein
VNLIYPAMYVESGHGLAGDPPTLGKSFCTVPAMR